MISYCWEFPEDKVPADRYIIMSDDTSSMSHDPANELIFRCPVCDSVVPPGANRCIMCGKTLPDRDEASEIDETSLEKDNRPHVIEIVTDTPVEEDRERYQKVTEVAPDEDRQVLDSVMHERHSRITLWLVTFFIAVTFVLGILILQKPPAASIAFFPTATNPPATITRTATWTPLPTDTRAPTQTPTITPTPSPTDTPRPARFHSVQLGDTFFGLALRFGITADSIAEANSLTTGTGLQVSQELIIPWPTATPPLVPVEIQLGEEQIVADPTDCRMYEIQSGDTFFGIASRERINLEALITVNRLTEQSILQPGDQICIPTIIRGGVIPPTPGPSPTPTETQPPPGPDLLFPASGALIESPDSPVLLQWVTVKELSKSEWYMVELTDLTDVKSYPKRAFTRQTSFQVPNVWRPQVAETHVFRWQVTIVRVEGEREDGSFIYNFGGQSSKESFFSWPGAIPSPTPTPSPTTLATPGG